MPSRWGRAASVIRVLSSRSTRSSTRPREVGDAVVDEVGVVELERSQLGEAGEVGEPAVGHAGVVELELGEVRSARRAP
jgi:hypothetical protein